MSEFLKKMREIARQIFGRRAFQIQERDRTHILMLNCVLQCQAEGTIRRQGLLHYSKQGKKNNRKAVQKMNREQDDAGRYKPL